MATFYRVRPLDEKIYRRASGSSDTLYVAFSISSALWWANFDKFVNAIGSAERIAKMQPKCDILDTVEAREKLLNQIGMLQIMYEGVYEKAIKFPSFALRALKDTFIGG